MMGCEGMSPSSHWKVIIAFSVVLGTSPSIQALEGIAGAPQSAIQHRNTRQIISEVFDIAYTALFLDLSLPR